MRKIIYQMGVSLDGYYEGPGGEIDWHTMDEEFHEYIVELLCSVDVLIFGRVNYEQMANYWTTPLAGKTDPVVAAKMNSLPKIVFSKSLEAVRWNNTRLIKDNAAAELLKFKEEAGEDTALLGGSVLASSLIGENIIDEFRIIISPVVLGDGHSLFAGLKERLHLRLFKTRVFRSGNVLLYYEPVKPEHSDG